MFHTLMLHFHECYILMYGTGTFINEHTCSRINDNDHVPALMTTIMLMSSYNGHDIHESAYMRMVGDYYRVIKFTHHLLPK